MTIKTHPKPYRKIATWAFFIGLFSGYIMAKYFPYLVWWKQVVIILVIMYAGGKLEQYIQDKEID